MPWKRSTTAKYYSQLVWYCNQKIMVKLTWKTILWAYTRMPNLAQIREEPQTLEFG